MHAVVSVSRISPIPNGSQFQQCFSKQNALPLSGRELVGRIAMFWVGPDHEVRLEYIFCYGH
jgi:hypothetical protein